MKNSTVLTLFVVTLITLVGCQGNQTVEDHPTAAPNAASAVPELTPASQMARDENPGVARVLICPPASNDANYIEWKEDLILFTLFSPGDYQSSKYFVVNVDQIRQEGEIFHVDQSGTILDIVDIESGQRLDSFDALENIEEFAWHPGGRQIALLTSNTDGPDNNTRTKTITILDIETGDNRQIVEIPTHCASGLQWSPDGSKLVWSMTADSNWDIFTFDVGQNTLSKITKEAAAETTPSWSPDGERLVYVSYFEGSEPEDKSQEICLVTLSSSHHGCLTDSIGEYKTNPGWSLTGDWVVFTSTDKDGKYISIIDLESKTVVRLIRLPNIM
jgi:Tol biopolymer transport system component